MGEHNQGTIIHVSPEAMTWTYGSTRKSPFKF